MKPDVRQETGRGPAWPWWCLLGACALAISLCDGIFLELARGIFGSGYHSQRIDGFSQLFGFAAGSIVLDFWIVLLLWCCVLALADRLIGLRTRTQAFAVAGMFGAGLPLLISVVRYNIHVTVGGMFNLALARQISGFGMLGGLRKFAEELPGVFTFTLGCIVLALVTFVLARKVEERWGPFAVLQTRPRLVTLSWSLLFATLVALAVVVSGVRSQSGVGPAFEQKASGGLLLWALQRATDFDLDGFGAFQRPPDPAPLDGSIYPYALDLPGNAIDENGLAGDHPQEFRLESQLPSAVEATDLAKPHLLILYLESFRQELIGSEVAGRAVTPFLDELAREGASTKQAYVHSPWTLYARGQFFTGRIVRDESRTETTIQDDFRARGYRIAHFSGQDDSFGDTAARLGFERADIFYDARQDIDRRTSRSVEPVSLQISGKTLSERVSEYLRSAPRDRPMMLYVNIVDTHYPYFHGEVEQILDVAPLQRSGIRAHRADEVRRAYANTAAYVDRMAREITAAFRAHIDNEEHAILVTADHGEAIYEDGSLGHGQTLHVLETRVPLILWGIGGSWPTPIANSQIRGLLRENFSTRGRAKFEEHPERSVLQYTQAQHPRFIAQRFLDDMLRYEFASDRLERIRDDGTRETLEGDRRDALLPTLVVPWEAVARTSR